MAVRIFVFALLAITIIGYFIPVEQINKKDSNEDIALLTFNDSTMYTLTTDSMNRIIYSRKVLSFKTRDVLYDGALTLKSKDKNNKEITDVLYSDVIIKRGDEFKFLNNVKYQRDDTISLNTNELIYNAKTKIATNTLPFDGRYFNNTIRGENIYLDLNEYNLKAQNAHFEIEVEKK